VEIIENSSEA